MTEQQILAELRTRLLAVEAITGREADADDEAEQIRDTAEHLGIDRERVAQAWARALLGAG